MTRLTNNGTYNNAPHWSPDGTKIAFSSYQGGNWEIYVMNADGSGQTNCTNNSATEDGLDWSPDGTKIAFNSSRGGDGRQIYVMNASCTGTPTKLTNGPGENISPSWSPDGTKLLFTSTRNGNTEIYVMNTDGSGQTNLTNSPTADASAVWSPDGTKIVWASGRPSDNGYDIYVMNADGSAPTQLTSSSVGDDLEPNWGKLVSSTVPLTAFNVQKLEIKLGPRISDDEFKMQGTFTLGAASNGIDPPTENVTLQIGTFSTTIPAGSFTRDKAGQFTFNGTINGVALKVQIISFGGATFACTAEGKSADLTGTLNPVTVTLTIGNDSGSTTATAKFG